MADAKEIVRRVEEAWDRNDLDALDGLIALDLVSHDAPPGLPPGLAGAKAGHSIFMASFPDRRQTIERSLAKAIWWRSGRPPRRPTPRHHSSGCRRAPERYRSSRSASIEWLVERSSSTGASAMAWG